jgi:hypothetical protein
MSIEKITALGSSSQDGDLNPFDISRLRLPQDFNAISNVKKLLTTVPVHKPDPQSFFQVHPEESWRLQTYVIEQREDRETYLVDPTLWSELSGEMKPKVLFTTINRQGVVCIWPILLPGPDGRLDTWNSSALIAAQEGMKSWIRLKSNRWLGAYEIFTAEASLPDPIWPETRFEALIEIAFKDRIITDLNHSVLRKLRGEI